MKIMIYENPFAHGCKIMPELMKHLAGLEVETALDLEDAERILSSRNPDYAVIHHNSLEEISNFRINYPHVKYIVYSGQFQEGWFNKNNIPREIYQLYDRVLHHPKDIREKIEELEIEGLGNE